MRIALVVVEGVQQMQVEEGSIPQEEVGVVPRMLAAQQTLGVAGVPPRCPRTRT